MTGWMSGFVDSADFTSYTNADATKTLGIGSISEKM